MKAAALFLSWVLLAVPCAGEIIIVDDGGYGDFNNIQAAIDDSNDGDIIYVFPGTYTGPANRDIDYGGRAVTVTGVAPEDPYIVAATVIDCNGSATENHRGFIFISGEGPNSVLAGLTITNGYSDYGGGIRCDNSSPTITNCIVTENSADYRGGGVYCNSSHPTITGCAISGNSSDTDGGGMCESGGTSNVSNCEFVENSASRWGGGICAQDGGPKATACLFNGNTAQYGGGIYTDGSLWDLKSCAFAGNVAAIDGGGVCHAPMVHNCTFSSNVAQAGSGGGIFGDYVSVRNCILWDNSDSGASIESAQISGASPWVYFSCIEDDDANDANIPFGGADSNNIDDNPVFVREPNDGGDGWGFGGNDDYGDVHLDSNSPCINAGDPFGWIAPGSLDIDGEPRVMWLVVDMGADEYLTKMLIVTRPESGEVWVAGSSHEILWDSQVYDGTVDILLSTNGGMDWDVVEAGIADTGSYAWNLPAVDSNQCVIAVVPSVPDANVVCVDSGPFTIHPDTPGPPVVSKWQSLGGDYDRMGLSENYGPELGCVKWEFEVDGAISASVTVGPNDTVYVPCEDGNLYKLDSNGAVLWSYEANSPLISSPSIGPDGTVYVGTESGRLHAVDIDGDVRWTHSSGGMVYSSPAVSADGSRIYVGSQDGKLYALGRDGSELWSFETGAFGVIDGAIFASPTIAADGTVYVTGLYDPNLYALDPNDGSVKWACRFDSNGWPFASPVVAPDGTIYQTLLYDPYLYAIDENDGNILWATNLSEVTTEGDPEIETWSYSRWFEPYYHEGGQCDLVVEQFKYRNARYNVGNSGVSEPVIGADGTIFVSFDDPWLRAVEPNGSIKWIRKPGPMSSYVEMDGPWAWYDTTAGATAGFGLTVDSNSLVYAASDDSNLYVFNAQGFEVARFDSNDYWLGFPVVSADNTLIVGDSRDNSMLISYESNRVWAISGDACAGADPDLYWQSGGQDVDGDGKVDNNDLKAVADCWLKCTDCAPDAYFGLCQPVAEQFLAGDINRDFYVTFLDFATLAQRWLAGY